MVKRSTNNTFESFLILAKKDENIRAALLTSSRANENAKTDFLSDYDIELYVDDIGTIVKDDSWTASIGTIMARWPRRPIATFDESWITRLFLFEDEIRMDFQITSNKNARLKNIDYGYRILVDKDDILTNLPEPKYSQFNIRKPTREVYETLVNEFWWNATYVPKYLWRDELPFAKMMMGQSIHDEYLKQIIEWHIGLRNKWNVSTGAYGRYFKVFLEPELWREYEETFCGADVEENWNSFSVSVELFSRLARNIGNSLGYDYPYDLEEKMRSFYMKIKNEEKKA